MQGCLRKEEEEDQPMLPLRALLLLLEVLLVLVVVLVPHPPLSVTLITSSLEIDWLTSSPSLLSWKKSEH